MTKIVGWEGVSDAKQAHSIYIFMITISIVLSWYHLEKHNFDMQYLLA